MMVQRGLYFAGFILLGVLVAPASITGIAIVVLLSVLLSVICYRCFGNKVEFKVHKSTLIADISIVLLLGIDFYDRWFPSRKVEILANTFHLSRAQLLYIAVIIITVLSIASIDYLIRILLKFNISSIVKKGMAIIITAMLEYYMLECSSGFFISSILQRNGLVSIANIGIILLVNLVLLWVFQKTEVALIVSVLLFLIWGVVNYYTIQFHGSPLFPSELLNARTALTIIGNYSYSVSVEIICVLICFVLVIYTIIITSGSIQESVKKRIAIRALITFLVAGISVLSFTRVINKYQAWMPWKVAINECGFISCSAQDLRNRLDPFVMPDGYSLSYVQGIKTRDENDTVRDDYPDIIYILNETFCDLEYYTNLSADTDYLSKYKSLNNAIYGNAIVPTVGGGTNNSEFEFLMSKSMYLLRSGAPFTYLSDEVENRSVVTYLEDLGYVTTVMHCEAEGNYNRNYAYPAIGFDNVVLGPDSFSHKGSYGNRLWLDSDNYKDLIKQYETLDECPRFMYILTMQNHGGYEQNDSSFDTVHTQNSFGNLTDDIDEFLTSISISAEAFNELTDYFENCNRKVIICMVGDHAPSFIMDLPGKEDVLIHNRSINMRTVPYVIWANYDMEIDLYTEYASMVDLTPMALKIAGLPLSVYYETILNLHEVLPVRTSDGLYVNREMQVGEYNSESQYYDLLKKYYYMEYNSMQKESEYQEKLFVIQSFK